MAYFKDLSRYEYSKHPDWCAGDVRNVGWLDAKAPFPQGNVDAELTAKLLILCRRPVNRYRGWHQCEFCNEYPVRIADSEHEICLGDGEIRVPRKDGTVVYSAPNLIYHYVVRHRYRPPEEFLDALRGDDPSHGPSR
jgi:hypothetical protein